MPALNLKPMLATLADAATHRDAAQWDLEFKWDGFRGLVHWNMRSFHLVTRNGLDMTERFAPIRALAAQLTRPMVLDGEVVALDADGVPRFGALQNWRPGQPLFLYIFDILQHGSTALLERGYDERRSLLEELNLHGEHWRVPARFTGSVQQHLDLARAHQLEGLVAKRRDSLYVPGRRSADWLKFKIVNRQEFAVCGFTPGTDPGTIGSLLLGYRTHGSWRFAGGMGTGFTQAQRREFYGVLRTLSRDRSPFPAAIPGRATAQWVEPHLVVEVEHRGWTDQGLLRVPAFLGIRIDKAAEEVRQERPRPRPARKLTHPAPRTRARSTSRR